MASSNSSHGSLYDHEESPEAGNYGCKVSAESASPALPKLLQYLITNPLLIKLKRMGSSICSWMLSSTLTFFFIFVHWLYQTLNYYIYKCLILCIHILFHWLACLYANIKWPTYYNFIIFLNIWHIKYKNIFLLDEL